MSHLEAELGKLAHNAFVPESHLHRKIERLAKTFGADPVPIMETVWRDRRVLNPAHLTPNKVALLGNVCRKTLQHSRTSTQT